MNGQRGASWHAAGGAILLVAALAAAACALAGCGGHTDQAPAQANSRDRLNVLLITLDTTRADRLGCYGYANAETPSLDALAARGVRFENAFTHVPMTLPSHATILTGQYPAEHGLRINAQGRLGAGSAALAVLLRGSGRRTGAFVASFVLDKRFGLDGGFDVYDDRMQPAPTGGRDLDTENPADVVTDRALAWLAGHADEPFFCWVHYFDPHTPYAPPEPYRGRHADPYDGEIAFMDAQIGRLAAFLDQRGLRERTLIVACGDHGEAFGEHEEFGHGPLVYEPTMRVPVLICPPGRTGPGDVSSRVAGLIDVAPTILAAVGQPRPQQMSGEDLLRPSPDASDRACYGESRYLLSAYGWAPLASATTARWRYIRCPEPELYDRAADPAEQRNLIASEPQVAAELEAKLAALEQRMRPGAAATVPLDREALAALRQLGYLGGTSAVAATAPAEGRKDPKAMMAVFNRSQAAEQQAGTWISAGDPGKAIDLLRPLLAEHPDLPRVRRMLVEACEAADDLGAARQDIEACLAWDPADRQMLARLGKILLSADKPAEAVRLLRHALQLPAGPLETPVGRGESRTSIRMRVDLGLALLRIGRQDEAIRQFQLVLDAEPANFQANNNLGCLYAERGEFDAAIRHLRAAVAAAPRRAPEQANLALTLLHAGRPADAVASAREAVRALPDSSLLHCVLGSALMEAGQLAEAERECREAVRLDPTSAPAHGELGKVLYRRKRYADGIGSWRQSLRLDPHDADVTTRLAWALATCPQPDLRNAAESVRLAESAVAATNARDPAAQDALAAAYAENSRFPEAIQAATKALTLARKAGDTALAAAIEHRLQQYAASRPYHDEP